MFKGGSAYFACFYWLVGNTGIPLPKKCHVILVVRLAEWEREILHQLTWIIPIYKVLDGFSVIHNIHVYWCRNSSNSLCGEKSMIFPSLVMELAPHQCQ